MYSGFRIPVIKIRDNKNKYFTEPRIVGTDIHDSLYINHNGSIEYYNLHNGDGTLGEGYSFVGEIVTPEYAPVVRIEFVSIKEAISIHKKTVKERKKAEKAIRAFMKKSGRKIIEKEKENMAESI